MFEPHDDGELLDDQHWDTQSAVQHRSLKSSSSSKQKKQPVPSTSQKSQAKLAREGPSNPSQAGKRMRRQGVEVRSETPEAPDFESEEEEGQTEEDDDEVGGDDDEEGQGHETQNRQSSPSRHGKVSGDRDESVADQGSEPDEDADGMADMEENPDETLIIYSKPRPPPNTSSTTAQHQPYNLPRSSTYITPPPNDENDDELVVPQSDARDHDGPSPPHQSARSKRPASESPDENNSEDESERKARLVKKAGKRRATHSPSLGPDPPPSRARPASSVDRSSQRHKDKSARTRDKRRAPTASATSHSEGDALGVVRSLLGE